MTLAEADAFFTVSGRTARELIGAWNAGATKP